MAFADNFNRANANLEASPNASGGGSWSHDGLIAGALIISGNQLQCNTTNSTGSAYKTVNQGSADHYVEFRAVSVSNGTGSFFACRLADRSNFVGMRAGNFESDGRIEVYRRVGGTLTNLYTSPGGSMFVGDVLRLECSGSTFTVKKNGAVVTGPTAIGDGSLTSSDTGIVARTVSALIADDFVAGAIAGSQKHGTVTLNQASTVTGTGHKRAHRTGAITSATSILSTGHKRGRGTTAFSTATSITAAGHKRGRGSTSLSTLATTPGSGHKRARGTAAVSGPGLMAGAGRKRGHGRVTINHTITLTGGKTIPTTYSVFDVDLDARMPAGTILIGKVY